MTTSPTNLRAAGKRLWASVADEWDLDEHEAAILLEAARTVDLLTQLDAAVRRDGPLVSTDQGPKVHPAAVEARQQRITLARLIAALRLPNEETGARPQRRGGARGSYGIRGAVK
jgi:hypothetical protein